MLGYFTDKAKIESGLSNEKSVAESSDKSEELNLRELKLDIHIQFERSKTFKKLCESAKTEPKSVKGSGNNDNLLNKRKISTIRFRK